MNNLAMPKGGTDRVLMSQAHEAVMSVLEGFGATHAGNRAFYSPEEWAERGEEYGADGVLVLVYDDSDLASFCDPMTGSEVRVEAMRRALADAGLWVEACTSWYSAVYRI